MSLWYDEIYLDESRFGLLTTNVLYQQRSDFQLVEVIDTPAFGRVLVIDGVFMTSDRDEYLYHEMLVHPALVTVPSIKRVLIVGGGDGGTAREALRHVEVESVVMVEIDGCVVEASKRFLPTLGAWDDPRLDVRIGDGIAYVKETTDEPFDVVLLDGTDPVGPGVGLFNRDFYEGVRRVLKPNGIFALQSESPFLQRDIFLELQTLVATVFETVTPLFGHVPLYSAGIWSWTHASKSVDPQAVDTKRLSAIEAGCKYYNLDIHRGAFAVPNELRKILGK